MSNIKLILKYIDIYACNLDNSNHQYQVHYITKLQEYGGWQTFEVMVVVLLLLMFVI